MNPLPNIPLAVVVAQFQSLGTKVVGVLAQLVTLLLGIAVAWITVVIIWKLLQEMARNPDFGKLLAIAAIGMFAVFLVGAAPDALDAAYAYGQTFMDGAP